MFNRLLACCMLTFGGAATAHPLGDAVASLAKTGFKGQVVAGNSSTILFDRTVGVAQAPDRWIWGSVSKQVTAALVMSEVDRGTLSLDDPISAYLPDFRNIERRNVTIGQLLQHTSGLANPDGNVVGDQVPSFYFRSGKGVGSAADALDFCAGPSGGEVGRFAYNNCDTIVAAAILEKAAKQSYSRLLARRITTPLKMASTRLARDGERISVGETQSSASPINIAAYGAAGAITGAARDLVRFDQALMTGKLMSAEARAVMWTGTPALGFAALGAWSFSAPLKGCAGPVKLIERRGSVDGVQSRNIIAPELNRLLVVFTPSAEFEFGEIWQGKGASYELASAAFCSAKASAKSASL